jgi:hypothetical protein
MTCPKCKGLGSIVKAHPSSGEFEILECPCQEKGLTYFCNDTGVVMIVDEIVAGIMSVREHYPSKTYRRIINYSLFQRDLKEGTISPLPKESLE